MKTLMRQTTSFLFLALFLLAFGALISCGGGSSEGPTTTTDTVDTTQCVPACEGKVCGDDGCGNSCGTCEEGVACSPSGQCGCAPACEGKVCGDDGCGGTCGACEGNATCTEAGACECTPSCEPGSCADDGCGTACECSTGLICDAATSTCQEDPACKGFSFAGCCDGTTLKFCENSEIKGVDCAANPSCGWNAENSFYNCGETENSTDPSGGNTGVCPDCTASCDGVEACGSDGCGGTCDTCEEGSSCFQDACCTPDCTDKACGSDGCGGTCGDCEGGLVCAAATGECIADPCATITFEGCCDGETVKYCEEGEYKEIDCSQNLSCGWSTSGSFYDCGTDGEGDPAGNHPKSCGPPCEPQCDGKVCGDNGCGGDCGACDGTCSADGSTCTPTPCVAGESCVPENPCFKGVTSCPAETGDPNCDATEAQPNGMACGGGKVCKMGDCVDA